MSSATNKISKFLTTILCLVIGVVFVVVGFTTNKSMKEADITWAEAQATIVAIVEDPDYIPTFDDDTPEYDVYVSYSIAGVAYENVKYGAYTSSWHVGDSVKIWYNVDNPGEITSPNSGMLPLIFIGMGILVIVVGVFILIKTLRTL